MLMNFHSFFNKIQILTNHGFQCVVAIDQIIYMFNLMLFETEPFLKFTSTELGHWIYSAPDLIFSEIESMIQYFDKLKI